MSFFMVPKNMVDEWKEVLKCDKVSAGKAVCERHFLPNEIEWKRKDSIVKNGQVLGTSILKIPRRKLGVIPSVFPWTDNWVSVHLEWQRQKQVPRGESENPMSPPIANSELVDEGLGSEIPSSPELNDAVHDPVTEGVNRSEPSVNMNKLIQADFNLPKGWRREVESTVHGIVLSFYVAKLIEMRDNGEKLTSFKTVIWKGIVIKPDLVPELYVLDQQCKGDGTPSVPIENIDELQNLLTTIDQLNVCKGSLLQNQLKESNFTIVHKDLSGVWRHNKCSLLVDVMNKEKMCTFCRRIKRTVKQKLRRVTKGGGEVKRIRIIVSPKKQPALHKLREKLRTAKRATTRANLKISELEDLQMKLQGCENSDISKHLEKGSITANTATALNEILSAAKKKGPKGRRYSEDWVLLCMLLHMRSPTGYKFIHDHAILPVPDVRTLRKYIAAIPASCGFDPKFFEVFKSTLARRDPKDRNGIILIDEMATRESLGVNAQTLSITGLIDFGEGEQKATQFTERANHGLVFIFQGLTSSYAQPIAVFASRGPAPGQVLSQLILKAIGLLENAGAKVHGVITDGASTNRRCWSTVNVSGDLKNAKNSFPHPLDENRRVYVFSDTPPLIKTIRNRLHNKGALQVWNLHYFYH